MTQDALGIEAAAAVLGLEVTVSQVDRGQLVVRRGELEVEVSFEPPEPDMPEVAWRHHRFCLLDGIRLGLDRRQGPYDLSQERPNTSATARNPYEIASVYGERMVHLVPSQTVEIAQRVGEFEPVCAPWVHPELSILLIRETARHHHVLSESDLDALPYDRDNMFQYARYALFYDAYKFRPSQRRASDGGQLRLYASREGRCASRATLMPDFDYDASQARGFLALPSRDTFIVAEPARATTRQAMHEEICQAAQEELESALFPMTACIFELERKEVRPIPDANGDEDVLSRRLSIKSIVVRLASN